MLGKQQKLCKDCQLLILKRNIRSSTRDSPIRSSTQDAGADSSERLQKRFDWESLRTRKWRRAQVWHMYGAGPIVVCYGMV